jgi:hypothetical protein
MSSEETVIIHHLVSNHFEQKKQHTDSYLCGLQHRFHLHVFNSEQTGRRNGVPVRAIKAHMGVEAELLLLLNLALDGGG